MKSPLERLFSHLMQPEMKEVAIAAGELLDAYRTVSYEISCLNTEEKIAMYTLALEHMREEKESGEWMETEKMAVKSAEVWAEKFQPVFEARQEAINKRTDKLWQKIYEVYGLDPKAKHEIDVVTGVISVEVEEPIFG